MFRRKKKRETEEALAVLFRERIEHGDGHGATPNGRVMSEPDEERADRDFTDELRYVVEEKTGEIQEGERASNVAGNDEARLAMEKEAADKVNIIWRQRLEADPAGTLDDLQARVNQLGYGLAYAGRTHVAPVTKRTYYITDTDTRRPIEAFGDGQVDLTLLEVCLWSELALRKWKDS
jgi:hypothetical protein